LVEHLLHAGGGSTTDSLFAEFQRHGIQANAYTAPDYLAVFADLPPEALRDWARLVERQVLAPSFDKRDVERELRVIAQEVASKVTHHPIRGFPYQHLRPVLFKDFENGHEGFVDNKELKALSLAQVRSLYRHFADTRTAYAATVGPLPLSAVAQRLHGTMFECSDDESRVIPAKGAREAARSTRRIPRGDGSPHGCATTFVARRTEGHGIADLANHQILAAILAQGQGARVRSDVATRRVVAQVGLGGDACEDQLPTAFTVMCIGSEHMPVEQLDESVRHELNVVAGSLDAPELRANSTFVRVGTQNKLEVGINWCKVETWMRLHFGGSAEGLLSALHSPDLAAIRALANALVEQPPRWIVL
jgi:hypothetical protein